MHPLLAWLPFLAALLVAFVAGVAFARVNEGWAAAGTPFRRGGTFGHYGADIVLSTALVGLFLATLIVGFIVAGLLLHVL